MITSRSTSVAGLPPPGRCGRSQRPAHACSPAWLAQRRTFRPGLLIEGIQLHQHSQRRALRGRAAADGASDSPPAHPLLVASTPSPSPPPGHEPDTTTAATAATTTTSTSHTTSSSVGHAAQHEQHQGLDKEILTIALPMLVALATDPIAGLVDTAFIGRIGAVELAGMGVALSIFNTVAKFLNVPLVSATTTAVANALGAARAAAKARQQQQQGQGQAAGAPVSALEQGAGVGKQGIEMAALAKPVSMTPSPFGTLTTSGTGNIVPQPVTPVTQVTQVTPVVLESHTEAVTSAASAALIMAAAFGIIEAVVLAYVGGWAVQLWGLAAGSPAHAEGVAFLRVRAASVPFTVLLLALQGVFRGLADTRTPLMASLSANVLNIVLAPALIFWAGWGVRGAAAAQGLAQVIPTLALLHHLSRKIKIGLVGAAALRELVALLGPSGFLLLRTASVTATYACATSAMAHLGATYAAAHQVAMSLWLATSLLADALAVAAQSLIARYTAEGDPHLARQVADRCVLLGGVLGVVVGGLLGLVRDPVAHIFTTDPQVLAIVKDIMPILIITQPINMLAFVYDGVLFGAGGFKYASFAMAACAVPALSLISIGTRAATPTQVILWVWMGLTLLMLFRAISIFVPYSQRLGPFRKLLAPGEAQGLLGRWAARVKGQLSPEV